MMKKMILGLATLLFAAASIFSLEVPALTGRVVDKANIISNHDENEITEYLARLEYNTGIQIAVLTVKSLQGESLEDYSMKVCEKWKLGQAGKDNGALLLVALNERKVRIEVGYGLEETLTDTKCGLIIRNVIIPEFREGDYSDGIRKGVKNMAGIAGNNAEMVSKRVSNPESSNDAAGSVLFGFMFVFGWFILFSCLASGRQNHFLPWIIFSSAFRSAHRGSGSYHSSSFHSSSGFGGGGSFHGGGGGFGGGGASGGW